MFFFALITSQDRSIGVNLLQLQSKSVTRVWLARGIAVAADILQIAVFPVFSEGIASPLNDALDAAVCIALTLLVGWHIAFVPTFIVKMLPFADLAPTWTVAAWLATRGRTSASASDAPTLPPPKIE